MNQPSPKGEAQKNSEQSREPAPSAPPPARPKETGGPKGLEPTRYGDWEVKGRCIDF
jgi:hypothetical protein